jgi:hypothetical protein
VAPTYQILSLAFFSLYASGPHLSALNSPTQSPQCPDPNLAELRPSPPAVAHRLPLVELAAPNSPSLARSAARPGRGRRCPHVPEVAAARTCPRSPPPAHRPSHRGRARRRCPGILPHRPGLGRCFAKVVRSLAGAGRVGPGRSLAGAGRVGSGLAIVGWVVGHHHPWKKQNK